MKHEQILDQIPSYVLGLLPPLERAKLEAHTAVCQDCRQQLHQESRVGALVQATLSAVSQPTASQLRQRMPKVPRRQQQLAWPKQVAVTLMLMLMLWSGALLYQKQFSNPMIGPIMAPHLIAETATMTQEPTMTLAGLEGEGQALGTAVPSHIPQPLSTPAPSPTPVAALAPRSLN